MSQDDEIERLLREVDALNAGGGKAAAPVPARTGAAPPATPSSGGRALRTGLAAGAVCGVGVGTATFLLQWLPLIDNPFSSAAGAFIGAFVTGTALSWRRKG